MDDLFNKAKEMAKDPAIQERLKSEVQKRFGGGGSGGAEGATGDAVSSSADESPVSGGAETSGMEERAAPEGSTSYGAEESYATDDRSRGTTDESESQY